MWGMMRVAWSLFAMGILGCSGNIGDSGIDPDGGLNGGIDAAPDAPAVEPDSAVRLARCDATDGDVSILDQTTGHCYFWVNVPVDRLEATLRCEQAGAELATISSSAENDIVGQVAPNVQPDPDVASSFDSWIGANDITVEGTFVWDGGEPFNFDAFRDGEPNNNNIDDPDGEDCVVFEGDSNLWDDRSCNLGVFRFICEREP